MVLADLLKEMEYECISGSVDIPVTKLVYNSKNAEPGSVFVCIKGAEADGHLFIESASKKGAAAVVMERKLKAPAGVTVILVEDTRLALACMSAAYFDYPARKLKTIGITGTKGKTTVTYMVKAILAAAGHKPGLIGTVETVYGDKSIPSSHTTPESYVIQETFRDMVEAGCDCVVMEVSSQGLKLNRTAGIRFDYGVFMNLEPDHIGPNEHEDLEDYIRCKGLLFRQCGLGIVNADSEYLDQVLQGHTCEVESFGFSEEAQNRAENVEIWKSKGKLGVSYHLNGPVEMDVSVDIPGRFSVYNSMAAIAVCRHFGVSGECIAKALAAVTVKGRIEIINVFEGCTFIIDYAHNAMSLENILTTLREYNPGRLICLFGCGGNRDVHRRYEMGEVSSRLADISVITSDNPRNEEPEDIIKDIMKGVLRGGGRYIVIPDRKEAIRFCVRHALEGDIILLAGKGHETYQEIRGIKHEMDERVLIEEVIEEDRFMRVQEAELEERNRLRDEERNRKRQERKARQEQALKEKKQAQEGE